VLVACGDPRNPTGLEYKKTSFLTKNGNDSINQKLNIFAQKA